jgi:predicted metal-dependent RNase
MPELQYSATPVQFPLGLANTKESDLKLSFHGADRSVTGSCHLVECAGKQILIDCGLHQGSRGLDEENAGRWTRHQVSIC